MQTVSRLAGFFSSHQGYKDGCVNTALEYIMQNQRKENRRLTPEFMAKLLFGLGKAVAAVTENCRIVVPYAYAQALKPILSDPWIIALCPMADRLDWVPTDLWIAYREQMRMRCSANATDMAKAELRMQHAEEGKRIRARNRLSFPSPLLEDIGSPDSLVLLPGLFWIELWPPDTLTQECDISYGGDAGQGILVAQVAQVER